MEPVEAAAREASRCRACDLWANATQTVFGEWAATADQSRPSAADPERGVMMLIGEQPGDVEDREGHPFVGPAGRLLDDVLGEAGVDRGAVYVTNAVKHFKWKPRGKRRIHDKPNRQEILACRPWLEREIDAVEPSVVVTLGATAAQSLLGSSFRITQVRGNVLHDTGVAPSLVPTIHPSAVLRAPDADTRKRMRAELTSDLRTAAAVLNSDPP